MRKIVQFFCALGLVFGLGATLTAQAAEPVSDLQASNITSSSASISWNGSGDRFELRYGLPSKVIFSVVDDADYEDLSGFSIKDSDGDGNNWGIFTGMTGLIHSGDIGFYSASYASGALTPDNWLVLPELELGGSISFWASGYSNWPEEHFGVGVFFEGDEELTMLDEWTATADPTQYVVDLSAYAGQTGYIVIRHFNCTDNYYLFVDDIEVIGAPQWIQVVDNAKNPFEISGLDPFTEYIVDVRSWAGEEASEWASLSFQTAASSEDQEAANYVIGLIDAIGTVEFPGSFDALNDAYSAYFALTETQQALVTNIDDLWEAIDRWNALYDEGLAINDLAVNHITETSANISWSSPQADHFDVRYSLKGLAEGFESGDFNGWTTVDNDGDGFNWEIGQGITAPTQHTIGDYCAISASYDNDSQTALTPDNWLISPQVELGGSMTLYATGQDDSYIAEHFAVYVSTTGKEISDFTQVSEEWEITTSKDYQLYTVDLSEFSGQGYVAIRHFNCTDMFYLNIDDITISTPVLGEFRDITSTSYELTGLNSETGYTVEVRGKLGEDFEGDWYSIDFTTKGTEPSFDIDNLRADEITANSALISWESDASNFDLRYRELLPGSVIFSDDFESGMENWTTIDNDGDGYNWVWKTDEADKAPLKTHNDSEGSVGSASYINNVGATEPDNWLVSPQVELGGTFSFWAAGQDPNYSSEIFGVYVSATGTDVADFVQVGSDFTATGDWEQIVVDLSDFSGKGYVAIRHYNVTDQFKLLIDDVEITGPAVEGSWIDVPALSDKSHLLDGLNPETAYEVQVSAAGADNWASVIFTTMPEVAPLEVINVEAIDITDNSATIQWYSEAQNFELRYREKVVGDVIFSDDFESGVLSSDWTVLDNDGDGNVWDVISGDDIVTHSGTACASSASYINNVGALTPDNWLVSPQVELGGTFSFWAAGQDASWSSEVFAVLVSTDDGESWTQVGEDITATGTMTQYIFDLSAFSGQGLVAIRHYNCTDMFRLNIDDVEIRAAAPETPWNVMSGISGLSQYLGLLNSNTTYDVEVRAVNGEEVGEWVATQFTTEMSEEDIQALVQPVIDLINAIGEVEYTLESYNAIVEANNAYSALPEDVQPYVTNYDVLEAAIDRFNELDEAAVADVIAFRYLVNAIDDPVTLESEDGIVAAREAYDALPELAIIFYSGAMADYVEALEAAEEALAQLKLQAAKDELQALIDDLKYIQTVAQEHSEVPAYIISALGTLISNAEAVLNNEEATLEQLQGAIATAKSGLLTLVEAAKGIFKNAFEGLKQSGDDPAWWTEIIDPAKAEVDGLAWDFSKNAEENIAALTAEGRAIYEAAEAALNAKRSAQGIEETLDGVQVKKVVIDNHVFILRGEKMFNMNGAEVK